MKKIYKNKAKHFLKLRDEEEKIIPEILNESSKKKLKNKRNKKNNYLQKILPKKESHLSLNIFISFILICETIILLKLYNSFKTKENNSIMSNNFKKNNYKIIDRKKSLKNAKNYLEICRKGNLIAKNKPITSKSFPIISIIIPIYKFEKSIKTTISSIQNQKMQDIEIIIINDYPNDNILNEIEDLKKEDLRIKLIVNNKTMGLLYSRCIGILEAKGKYITTIDNEDIFSEEDVLNVIYNEAQENYFDIISFKGFVYSDSNFEDYKMTNIIFKNNNNTIYQPELGIFPQNENDPLFFNSNILSGKLIKKGVYRAAINIMGKERYSTNLFWKESSSIFFIICNIAQSFKFIDKYGLIHFESKTSNSDNNSKDDYLLGEIFLIDIIFDYSKNEFKKSVLYKLNELKNKEYFILSNQKIKAYLKIVIRKIINCEFIEEKDKEEIKKKFIELSPLN
jgi:glycosyltransferase involved in cell wall biosynthesis